MDGVAIEVELFGTAGCPYTSEVREHLLWNRIEFIELEPGVPCEVAGLERYYELAAGLGLAPAGRALRFYRRKTDKVLLG